MSSPSDQPTLVQVTYEMFKTACADLALQIHKRTKNDNSQVKMIIGLSRGGLPIAVELSHQLSAPLIPVCYSAKSGHGDNKNHLNNLPDLPPYEYEPQYGVPTVVIVDDIADSGHTLEEVRRHYFGKQYSVQTAVMYWKTTSVHWPTYHWHEMKKENESDWIVFPWEIPPVKSL